MRELVVVFVFALLCVEDSLAKISAPKVQVYSRRPGEHDKDNVLICHASGFHPPEISIELLRGDQVIPGAQQTDLAFADNWYFHLTKFVPFTPSKGEQYHCRVTHMGQTNKITWESDM